MEQVRRNSILNRLKFKSCVRRVIRHLFWLQEVQSEATLLQKAKIFITMKKKSLLTLHQKYVLLKPTEVRTREEMEDVCKSVGDIRSLRNYPLQLKMEVIRHGFFGYWPPDRTIIAEGHPASAMYFMMSGEVNLTSRKFGLSEDTIQHKIGTMGAGQSFGELSLIYDAPRKFSAVTTTHTEFIILPKQAFNDILKTNVLKEWSFITNELMKFSYFASYSQATISEACIIAKRLSFKREETILGDGEGLRNHLHFVISGKCQMIEHLLVERIEKRARTYHKLWDRSTISEHSAEPSKSGELLIKGTGSSAAPARESSVTPHRQSKSVKSVDRVKTDLDRAKSLTQMMKHDITFSADEEEAATVEEEEVNVSELPKNVECYFMQVCILSQKAAFPFGDMMRNRRIIAMSDRVEIIAMPRYWVNQLGNQWLNVQRYMEIMIPSTEEIFDVFVRCRKWRKFTEEMARGKTRRSDNVPQNVPYSVRIHEDFKFVELQRNAEGW